MHAQVAYASLNQPHRHQPCRDLLVGDEAEGEMAGRAYRGHCATGGSGNRGDIDLAWLDIGKSSMGCYGRK